MTQDASQTTALALTGSVGFSPPEATGSAAPPKVQYRLIPLTRGRFAIVDAADYEWLRRYKWHASGRGNRLYAVRDAGGRRISMHREILQPPPGMMCDHKNHIRLDNRRSNLRICTPSQNQQNRRPGKRRRCRYKGVSWNRRRGKWKATIGYQNRILHIGYYDFAEDAAIAYDDRAIALFGEFACLNCHYRPEISAWLRA